MGLPPNGQAGFRLAIDKQFGVQEYKVFKVGFILSIVLAAAAVLGAAQKQPSD